VFGVKIKAEGNEMIPKYLVSFMSGFCGESDNQIFRLGASENKEVACEWPNRVECLFVGGGVVG